MKFQYDSPLQIPFKRVGTSKAYFTYDHIYVTYVKVTTGQSEFFNLRNWWNIGWAQAALPPVLVWNFSKRNGVPFCSSRSSCLRVSARKSSAASKVPEQEALTMPWDWRHCHCDAKTSQLDKGWAHCAAQNHVSHLYIWLPQSNRSRVICARPQRSPEPLQTTLWILIAW